MTRAKGYHQSPEHIAKRIAATHATTRARNSYCRSPQVSEETRRAASERMKAMWKDPAWREKTLKVARTPREPQSPEHIEKRISHLRGRPQSSELIAKRAAGLMGHAVSDETREKIGAAHCGKKMTDESRAKMSLAQTGRTHSQETKAKIGLAHRGRKMSDEIKKKLSDANTGRKHTAETRAKVSAALRLRVGPLSGNWKGGITPYRMALRNEEEVRVWRRKVFERDHFTCGRCGQVGGCLNAHHLLPFKQFVQFRTELLNGITLCVSCHKQVHADMRHERSRAAGILP